MNYNKFKISFNQIKIILVSFAFLALPFLSLAADSTDPRTGLGAAAPDSIKKVALTVFIGELIKGLLSLIGVLFLCLMIYAGFLWMTASGDEGKVKKSKDIMTTSVIGLIIVLASYAITLFVIKALGIQ